MTDPGTMSMAAAVFLWVYSCLLAAIIRALTIKSGAPWWKIFLGYVALPLTAGVALCMKILRTFF